MNFRNSIFTFVLLFLSLSIAHSSFADTSKDGMETVLFKKGDLGYNTFRIPAILAAKDGTLLVFIEGRLNSDADHGRVDMFMRRSLDGGKTWEQPRLILSDGKNSCGNPQPILDKATGDIVLFYYWANASDSETKIISGKSADRRRAFIVRSSDNGKTWGNPKEITGDVLTPDMTWYVAGPGGGIQIEGGKYDGRMVSAFDTSILKKSRNIGEYYAGTAYSDDGGKTWKLGGIVDFIGGNECQVAQIDADTLVLNMRVQASPRKIFNRVVAVSKDGGESWSRAFEDDELPEPMCQGTFISVKNSPELAKSRGERTLVFCNPADKHRRVNLTVKFSDTNSYKKWLDETLEKGKSDISRWHSSYCVCSSGSGYSDMAIMANGDIALVYERGDSDYPGEKIIFRIVKNPLSYRN